jgi:hypothetical protein
MIHSHHHAVALSPLTYAENLANYLEGEAVWRIVRKSVEITACLTSSCLRTRRSWDTLKKTITCVLRRFICVERYGIILIARISLHDVILLALRPPRNNDARWEDLFLSGTLQYSQVGLFSYALTPY